MSARSARIEVEGLRKRFGTVEALRGVDLQVPSGRCFALLGPSGCGKTTLLRVLAGFERADEGTVRFGGEDVTGQTPQAREVGMVFQSYAVFPHLSVAQNVAFGPEARGVKPAEVARRVGAALEEVGLGDLGERLPEQLSGGQQQRVGLARALAAQPRVLLMDEPLSNLDARLRVQTRERIRAIQQARGITTVYVTHDQDEALAVADQIAVLRAGEVLQVGDPRAIYTRPEHAFVAEFVGACARLPGAPTDELWLARPEDVRVVEQAPSEGWSREGVVVAETFLGPVARCRVEVEGALVEVETHRPRGPARAPGERVRVAVAEADVKRFDAASGVARA